MKNDKNSKILIVILSVLLAGLLALLGIVINRYKRNEERRRSEGNFIGDGTAASDETKKYTVNDSRQVNVVSLLLSAGENEEKLKITENGAAAKPFNITNMLPGDSESKAYVLKINEDTANTLFFSAKFTDNTIYGDDDVRKARNAELLNISVKIGDSVQYNGPLGNISEVAFPLYAQEEVKYDIVISLEKSAGNEFANLDLSVSFVWRLSYEDRLTVSYEDGVDGEIIFETQTYEVGKGSVTPAFIGTPMREGYVFDKWTPSVSETVTENVTYKATWIKRHKVTFNYDEKTSVVLVNGGTAVSKIYAPKVAGYGFAGWYLDETFTKKYDFSTPVNEDLDLYGRFFLWGDVDLDGYVTVTDAGLVNKYIMEVDNKNIRCIMAGRVTSIDGTVTVTDAGRILAYIREDIDEFPVERYVGYEYDLENDLIIPPIG